MRIGTRRWLRGAQWIISGLALALAGEAMAQQPTELVVRNGLIVTSVGRTQGDLRIRDGTIVEIGANLTPAEGARVIDATGRLVLPGGVDTHVHLTPVRTASSLDGTDDFTSASRAALAGGTTTIGTFINQDPDESPETTMTEAADVAERTSIADVVLHYTVSDPTLLTPSDVAMLYERQFTIKIFMSRAAFDQNAHSYVNLIRAAGEAGVVTQLHAQDAGILSTTVERMVAEGRTALVGQNFADAGPVVAEEGRHPTCGRHQRGDGRAHLFGPHVGRAPDARSRGGQGARAAGVHRGAVHLPASDEGVLQPPGRFDLHGLSTPA